MLLHSLTHSCLNIMQVQSSYSLIVEARDRDGDAIGLGERTTVQIKVLDVNDNIPYLEKSMVSEVI